MEALDEFVLTDPQAAIIDPGAAIIMAEFEGEIAGAVALRKLDAATFEFSKMAVDECFRRRGTPSHWAMQVLSRQMYWERQR